MDHRKSGAIPLYNLGSKGHKKEVVSKGQPLFIYKNSFGLVFMHIIGV